MALAFGGLFLLIVVLCLLAPVYSDDIAHIGPNDDHITERSRRRQLTTRSRPASRSARPGTSHFLLGADSNGRDVAVRLLYGGRNSLLIGAIATLITIAAGDDPRHARGLHARHRRRGPPRFFELLWAYPACCSVSRSA